MKISLSQLPPEVVDRLKDIQENHEEYAGFYQKGSGRGWAIAGLVYVIPALFASLFYVGMGGVQQPSLIANFATALFNLWLLVYCCRYITRYNKSPIKPYTFLNPLYLTKVTTSDVTYYNLWRDREDLNITHHYTNGIYTHTEFVFQFSDGVETLNISPRSRAEELMDQIDAYRLHMLEAIETDNYDSIIGHDLFFEIEHGDHKPAPKKGGWLTNVNWKVWATTASAAALLSVSMYFMQAYTSQDTKLSRCERYTEQDLTRSDQGRSYNRIMNLVFNPVRCYDQYFRHYKPIFLQERARKGLVEAYKKQFRQASGSATKMREMMGRDSFAHLDADRSMALKKHFAEEGKTALGALYDNAIASYKRKATTAYPAAKKAIIKLLELAKNKDNYIVKVTYNRKIKALLKQRTYKLKSGRVLYLEPMAPSFTAQHNAAREGEITGRVRKSFKKIIPEEILQFDNFGDLEFNITYSLRPESVYTLTSKRRGTVRYYRGIRIFWHFKILDKGKLLYEYLDTTRPAKRFSVRRSYGYKRSRYLRYASSRIPNATMYDKMAATTFDAYGRRILVHFGVQYPSYTDRKARKVWKMYKKLGVLKELAAGKSWKDIDLADRFKKAGLKAPRSIRRRPRTYKRAQRRSNRYKQRRYKQRRRYKRRYRRARYRYNRRRRYNRYNRRRYKRRTYRKRSKSWLD